jgi:hypothetical protein
MEFQQYTATETGYASGPDAAILIRHDRALLLQLAPSRTIGALFCNNLSDLLEALVEMPPVSLGLINPGRMLASEYNAEGDRIDNFGISMASQILAQSSRPVPTALDISSGYGARQIAAFVAREAARKITVIGGLPTVFDTFQEGQSIISVIRILYLKNGGDFMMLPNHSQYPREDFFNSEDHLTIQCQYLHSILIANMLAAELHRRVRSPPPNIIATAKACPSAPGDFTQGV